MAPALNPAGAILLTPLSGERKLVKTFEQVIEQLRDGKGYAFGHHNLKGCFYKAPYPEQKAHTIRDGASSAITFWQDGKRAMPTLMLYDFDDPVWWVQESDTPIP